MSGLPLAFLSAGMVSSVGFSAPASCAAIRAKLTNPSETRFLGSAGEWIVAHQVEMEKPWRGLTKLAKMASMAIEEALAELSRDQWSKIPMLLCVAELDRPGRFDGIDDRLMPMIQTELGVKFAAGTKIVPHGRVSVAVALAQARRMLEKHSCTQVLIAATDCLLTWPTLSHYEREDRLLTASNSNGFMPGEGAGALLVAQATGQPMELSCTGIGLGMEAAHIDSGEPLRADGLSQAIKAALTEAGREMFDIDFRITDISGEQYYFKEAALALARTLHRRKEEFDIWHPAECTGEQGAVAGVSIIALAREACRKAYTKGPNIVAHMANDAGSRAALTLQYRSA
jgi:3-oxoacyl-[acyl-carrier-protein] synthase I